MKILPISDIHGDDNPLHYILDHINNDDFDIVVVAGDVWEGTSPSGKYKWDYFQKQIKKPIIMVQGNHDYWSNSTFDNYKNIHLLHNESVTIDGIKFFGTPYTVNFMDWNWMNDEDKLYEMWKEVVPENIDVLISHGPPFGICDNCNQHVYGNNENTHLGSKALREIILEKNPKYVFCGHIHSADKYGKLKNIKIYNVSCLDEAYKFLGFNPPPEVIELKL